ncbi:DeoR family transcriptional regulator [Pasteurella multocida]|nr:DeoR family transcriptional regulator [Pasteurella multocida]
MGDGILDIMRFLNRIQRHSELDMICTNKAFISAAGVAIQQGVTCFNFDEAKAKQRVMEKTQQAFFSGGPF